MTQQVSNEDFLAQLTRLFESSSQAHSVFITHKRVSRNGSAAASSQAGRFPIVVRATDGKGKAAAGRTKFTTHVEPENFLAFQESYSAILRTSTAAFLRKRDKAKERRADKLLKEKRKRLEESTKDVKPADEGTVTAAAAAANNNSGSKSSAIKVTQIGSKRGAGRRKRQQARQKAQILRRERTKIRLAAAGKAGTVNGGGGVATG